MPSRSGAPISKRSRSSLDDLGRAALWRVAEVPRAAGAYVVYRATDRHPDFVKTGTGGLEYSIRVRMIKTARAVVEVIDEDAWRRIDYSDDGEAQIAETVHGDGRLIFKCTRPDDRGAAR